jgi:hypothetical protein
MHFIAEFVKRRRGDRYREILSNPRLRHKFINQLAHFKDFDPKYRLSTPSNKLFVANLALELQKRHSPNIVFAISEDPALDQKEFPLVEALKQIVGRGMGTVLSCIPGRLAFVETEDERFILEHHDPLEKREYVRFVIGRKDEESHVEQGVFQAAAQALEWKNITGFETPTNCTNCARGSARIWKSQPPSDQQASPRHLLVQDRLHRAHLPHLGDGPHPRTQRHLREENQNRQTRLRDLRRRMATIIVAEPFRKGTMPRS